jgi:hypothetical protein
MSGSLLFTIGTALNRAHLEGLPVQVLVEGAWIGGQVAWQDGQGVLIVTDMDEHAVVRLSSISAVKVLARSPIMPALDHTTGTPA